MRDRRRHTILNRLRRLIRYRLVIPLHRTPHPPEYTARGVAVGILWAFTPLIPFQMYLTGMTWAAMRWSPRTDFNLLLAIAWVWVTNVFTMGPVYYVFYLTGQMMLGRWEDLTGYGSFTSGWRGALEADTGLLDTAYAVVEIIISEQGAALALGCLPYSLGGAWLGYHWSLRYVRRRQEEKRQRLRERNGGMT